jgi:hypothetical protein
VQQEHCQPQHHPQQQNQQDQQPQQQQAHAWDAGTNNRSNSSSSWPVSFCLHSEHGLPVLHQHQLQAWLEQQQQQQQGLDQQQQQQQVYLISSWEVQWGAPLHGLWSEYYKTHAREPDNTELAPWVAKRYKRFRRQKASS